MHGREQIVEAADPKLSGDNEEHEMKLLMIVGLFVVHIHIGELGLPISIKQAKYLDSFQMCYVIIGILFD